MEKEHIKNVTEEELNQYLKSIGGLEYGYREYYWGDNIVRLWAFKIARWILYKFPYDKRPRNPFRDRIYDCGFFEIGKGWYGLVKSLIEKAITAGWDKEICQVKEKYAGLRFYINGASKEVHDIIHEYENLSYHICEDCGEPGEVL